MCGWVIGRSQFSVRGRSLMLTKNKTFDCVEMKRQGSRGFMPSTMLARMNFHRILLFSKPNPANLPGSGSFGARSPMPEQRLNDSDAKGWHGYGRSFRYRVCCNASMLVLRGGGDFDVGRRGDRLCPEEVRKQRCHQRGEKDCLRSPRNGRA